MATTFELTYAGFPFQVVTPEIEAWIANRLPQQYLQETAPPPAWLGRALQAIAQPNLPPRPPLAINELYYPTGASRWAEGRFLATETQALAMINACYDHTVGTKPQFLTIRMNSAGTALDRDPSPGLSTLMFMLPPRPLLQVDKGGDGLYLITLVDARYYGYHVPSTVQIPNGMGWSDYLQTLATAIGVTLAVPPIPTGYGSPSPDSSLWCTQENAAYLLDIAAWNVGCSVVRNLDGTFNLISLDDTSYFATRPRFNMAGGAFSDALDAQNLIPTLEAVLPRFVSVAFPKYWEKYGYMDATGTVAKPGRYNPRVNEPYWDTVTKTVNIATATGKDVQGNPLSSYHGSGTRGLRTSAKAYFVNFADPTPANDANLQTLASLLANQLWSHLALGMDETYIGIRGWQPESAHDVLWTYRTERPITRVMRRPWNTWPTDFQHELTPNGGDQNGANSGPAIELVLAQTSTADGLGRYDANIQTKVSTGANYSNTSGEAVWLHAANGEAIVSGTSYLARLMTVEQGRKIFSTSRQGAAGAYTLTVERSDNSQAVSSVSDLQVDPPESWKVSTPSAGIARLRFAPQAFVGRLTSGTTVSDTGTASLIPDTPIFTPTGYTIVGNNVQLPAHATGVPATYVVTANVAIQSLVGSWPTTGAIQVLLALTNDAGTSLRYAQTLNISNMTFTLDDIDLQVSGILYDTGASAGRCTVGLSIENGSGTSVSVLSTNTVVSIVRIQ